MKLIEGRHITATDRKAIASGIANGWTTFHTKRKDYRVKVGEEGTYEVEIVSKERNDWGKLVNRCQRVTVAL